MCSRTPPASRSSSRDGEVKDVLIQGSAAHAWRLEHWASNIPRVQTGWGTGDPRTVYVQPRAVVLGRTPRASRVRSLRSGDRRFPWLPIRSPGKGGRAERNRRPGLVQAGVKGIPVSTRSADVASSLSVVLTRRVARGGGLEVQCPGSVGARFEQERENPEVSWIRIGGFGAQKPVHDHPLTPGIGSGIEDAPRGRELRSFAPRPARHRPWFSDFIHSDVFIAICVYTLLYCHANNGL
jgi:hypothetical protein